MKNNITKLEMYEVVCKCGHVGKSHYMPISFAIMAQSGKEAASIAREMPRVKHNHKDAILNVRKINQDEYTRLSKRNYHDSYLHCRCIQDQNLIDISDRLMDEKIKNSYKDRKDENGKDFYYSKKKIRNVKKYINHYLDLEEYNDISA